MKRRKREFSYILSPRVCHSVSVGYLWLSIFYRLESNQFTHVQRCICCFILIFISIFLNIMDYHLSAETKPTNGTSRFSLVPIYLNPQEIIIGIVVEFIILNPFLSTCAIISYRRCRPSSSSSKPVSPVTTSCISNSINY